ncbi:MAG: polysaccharide lyase family 7 protein, partial [Actinomycetes bacterium]
STERKPGQTPPNRNDPGTGGTTPRSPNPGGTGSGGTGSGGTGSGSTGSGSSGSGADKGEEKGGSEKGSSEKGEDKGSEEKGSEDKGSDEKSSDEKSSDEKSEDKGSEEKGGDEKSKSDEGEDKGSSDKSSSEKDDKSGKSEQGSSTSTASTGASGGTSPAAAGAAAGSAQLPGDLLDLENFFLTLPIGPAGDPDSIDQPELLSYTSEYFQLTPERDGVVFRAHAGGVTTKNSKYPRSELREMNGEEKAAWSNASGTHTLEAREAITEIPTAKPEVVAAQIHDGGDDVMQVRLEGQNLVAQYADGKEQIVIDPAYKLGTPYDLRIEATSGKITVFYNGEPRAEIPASGTSWYFKIGAYIQSNPEKGDSPDAAGEVVVYSLKINHTA